MSLTKKLAVGIDWISASAILKADTMGLYEIGMQVKNDFPHGKERSGSIYGFKGLFYHTDCCGHMFYGENRTNVPSREIIQMGGWIAEMYWRKVYNSADNISRLDLKVDAELYRPDPNIAKICFKEFQKGGVLGLVGVKTYSLIEGNKGQTLYIGSRKSLAFGRLYDKSAEAKLGKLGSIWRYEVELKDAYARQACEQLEQMFSSGKKSRGIRAIALFVYEWFDTRGVPPIFDLKGEHVETIEMVARNKSGDTLLWLRKSVSPTVRRLIAKGQARQVYTALGIEGVHKAISDDVRLLTI